MHKSRTQKKWNVQKNCRYIEYLLQTSVKETLSGSETNHRIEKRNNLGKYSED